MRSPHFFLVNEHIYSGPRAPFPPSPSIYRRLLSPTGDKLCRPAMAARQVASAPPPWQHVSPSATRSTHSLFFYPRGFIKSLLLREPPRTAPVLVLPTTTTRCCYHAVVQAPDQVGGRDAGTGLSGSYNRRQFLLQVCFCFAGVSKFFLGSVIEGVFCWNQLQILLPSIWVFVWSEPILFASMLLPLLEPVYFFATTAFNFWWN